MYIEILTLNSIFFIHTYILKEKKNQQIQRQIENLDPDHEHNKIC